MSHSTQGKSSYTLDQFLGLVTNASPDSLPEGASPMNWDCDFIVGSVFTRAGVISPYSFAAPPG